MKSFNIHKIGRVLSSSEGWLYILIGCVWGYSMLGIVNAVVLRLPIIDFIGPYARDIIIVIAALLASKSLIKYLKPADFIFYILLLTFYVLQFLIHPENDEYLTENFLTVFFVVVPMYFIGCVLDINQLYKYLLVISVVCIVYMSFHDLFYATVEQGDTMEKGEYVMGPAYSVLPCVMFLGWRVIIKYDIISIVFLLLGLILLISYGTRGPLFCFFAFAVLYMLFMGKSKIWSILILALIVFLVFFYFDTIILFLDDLMSRIGMSTRITQKFLQESLDDDSGRGDIILILKRILDNGDKISYGLFGSYPYVTGYAHRIYWDFWFSFGYFIGTIIMLILCGFYMAGIRKCYTKEDKGFWLLLFCNSIVALMFSGCYIISGPFFLFLGYNVSRIRNQQLKILYK